MGVWKKGQTETWEMGHAIFLSVSPFFSLFFSHH